MEDPQVQGYNSSLEKVLKSYQTVAMSSLGGPSSYRPSWAEAAVSLAGKQLVDPILKEAVVRVSASKAAALEQAHVHRSMASAPPAAAVKVEYDPLLHPPPFPIQQMPVFTPIDQTKSEKGATILEDEAISCFAVGGEKRLCLPQILNIVLRDFSLQQINAVCDELHIYCSRCSPEQLEILKVTGREKLLHELARIRIRQEERLQDALAAKRNYQQEMEFLRLTKKDKMREAMESKRSLRKELDRVRIEYERKLRESNDSRHRLKRDLEHARSRRNEKSNEIGRDNERLVSQNEYLKDRVRDLEEERDQLRRELQRYQHEKADESKDGEKGKGEKKEEMLEKGERLDQSSNRDSSLDCDGQKVVEKKMIEVKKEKEDLESSEKVKDGIDRSPPQRDV